MPETTIYHLTPRSAFHFGVRGLEQESTGVYFPSDSLFAALLTAWMELGNDPAALAELFPRETMPDVAPPFLLTSVFPRAGGVRFYPALPLRRMLSPQKLDELNAEHRLKEVKKIKFISECLFERVAAGAILDEFVPASETPVDTDAGRYMQGSTLWLAREEAEQLPQDMRKTERHGSPAAAVRHAKVWAEAKVPRVTVDRISNASQIFHTGRVRFQKDCGLWFGIRWLKPDAEIANGVIIRTAVETALDILGDSGIGAERSAGYGQFSLDTTDAPQCLSVQSGNQFVTLSRFHPGKADAAFGSETSYKLESVSGWVRSPVEPAQRRRRVWFVQEGSILQASSTPNPGRIVDVRPRYNSAEFSHPVWRYGLAFPVGLADRREK